MFKEFKRKVIEFKSKDFSKIKLGFVFGLMMESYYLIKDFPELTGEKVDLSHSLFSEDDVKKLLPIILIAENAENDAGQSDLDYKKPGRDSLQYILTRAIEFNRPDYCIFFIFGLIRGSLNAGLITKDEFLELLTVPPSEFIQTYGEELAKISNHFDETNCEIQLSKDKKKLVKNELTSDY